MVTVSDPDHFDGTGQCHAVDIGAVAERITFALDDQCRTSHVQQMRRAQFFRLLCRMERVANTYAAQDLPRVETRVGQQARDTPPHGLAADEQWIIGCLRPHRRDG